MNYQYHYLIITHCVAPRPRFRTLHYSDAIMGAMASQDHQPQYCLLNRLFRRRSMKTSKLRVTGRCAGNSSVTGEFPAQMASNAEDVSI